MILYKRAQEGVEVAERKFYDSIDKFKDSTTKYVDARRGKLEDTTPFHLASDTRIDILGNKQYFSKLQMRSDYAALAKEQVKEREQLQAQLQAQISAREVREGDTTREDKINEEMGMLKSQLADLAKRKVEFLKRNER